MKLAVGVSLSKSKGHFVSEGGYANDLYDDHWYLSRDIKVDLSWVNEVCASDIALGVRKLLKHYAVKNKPAHVKNSGEHLKNYFNYVLTTYGLNTVKTIKNEHLLSYRSTFSPENSWKFSNLRGCLRKWQTLRLPGHIEKLDSRLQTERIKGNAVGEAVALKDPLKGAFTPIELKAIFDSSVDAFEKGNLSLSDYAFLRLLIATGRRPSQIGDLKAKDLIRVDADSDTTVQHVLRIPRRKQRGVEWRDEFRNFAITEELGLILESLIEENVRWLKQNTIKLNNQVDLGLLPIFMNKNRIMELDGEITEWHLASEFFHKLTDSFRKKIKRIEKAIDVISERTGKPIHLFPYRFRRTKGTETAREGYGALTIAEILDHTGINYAKVYTEHVPEFIHKLNSAMSLQLAPIAQAFSGRLIKDKSQSPRGDDPRSLIRDSNGAVGNCGHFGDCYAAAPIACYTCKNFNPWLDAPHKELLEMLIAERERIQAQTGDGRIASVNDRTILAIAQVVDMCEKIKNEKGLISHEQH